MWPRGRAAVEIKKVSPDAGVLLPAPPTVPLHDPEIVSPLTMPLTTVASALVPLGSISGLSIAHAELDAASSIIAPACLRTTELFLERLRSACALEPDMPSSPDWFG